MSLQLITFSQETRLALALVVNSLSFLSMYICVVFGAPFTGYVNIAVPLTKVAVFRLMVLRSLAQVTVHLFSVDLNT